MKKRSFISRITSLFLAVMLFSVSVPAEVMTVSAASPDKTSITDSETFEYLIDKVEGETSAYIAARLRLLIYGDDTSNIYNVGHSFPGSSSYQTIKDGEIGQRIPLKSAQCYAYAEWAYYKFFGASRYTGADFVWQDENVTITESSFREAMQDAKCGAHVRIANKVSRYQHSITFITNDEEGTGFYYLEGTGSGSGGYVVKLCHATYAAFAETYRKKKLNYVQLPTEYPECDEDAQLGICNAKVPVNVKTGSAADIIGTTVMSDCDITSIVAGVYTSSGKEKFKVNVTPNCRAYRFGVVVDGLFSFSSLSSGTYVYRITATDESGANVSLEQEFTVSSSPTKYTKTEAFSYSVTPFDSAKYYETAKKTKAYSAPDTFSESSSVAAGTVIKATGSYTADDGTVWLRIGSKKWIAESSLSPHKHKASDTGLCTATGCDHDSTAKPVSIGSKKLVTLKKVSVKSRPYTAESETVATLSKHTVITSSESVTNLSGELWYKTSNGYVLSTDLDTVSSITVEAKPDKTEYIVNEKFDSDGLSLKVNLKGGTSYTAASGMTFSYSFSAIGSSTVTVNYAGKKTSFTVNVKPVAGQEMWKVQTSDGDDLNIRSGAGTDHSRVGEYINGTVITVTEIKSADGYVWGKTAEGWVALDFCVYVSGYMYEITYDLNGAEGDIPSSYKNYGKNITVTSDVPELEDSTFLGWSEKSTATAADYKAGDKYTKNSSTVLYAVWKSNKPITGEISISGTPAYGSKLKLDTSALSPTDAKYTVTWMRLDGDSYKAISGATETTYTLTGVDIGYKIAVRITGADNFIGTVTSEPVTVTKKKGASAGTPTLESVTSDTITVTPVSGAEYSLDGTKWQSSNVFSGLKESTSYTVYIRMAETETSKVGATAKDTFRTTSKIPTSLTSSVYKVNNSEKTVSGVSEKVTAKEFLSAFGEKGFVSLVTADGDKVNDDANVGTGMKVVLGDGKTVIKEYRITVTGDVNGDGKINVSDAVSIKAYILKTDTLADVYFTAADINGDGKVNVTDFVSVKSHVLHKTEIKPRTA